MKVGDRIDVFSYMGEYFFGTNLRGMVILKPGAFKVGTLIIKTIK